MANFKRMYSQLPRLLPGAPEVSSSSCNPCWDMAKCKGQDQLDIYMADEEQPKPFQLTSLLLGAPGVHNLLIEEKDAPLILPRG